MTPDRLLFIDHTFRENPIVTELVAEVRRLEVGYRDLFERFRVLEQDLKLARADLRAAEREVARLTDAQATADGVRTRTAQRESTPEPEGTRLARERHT